MKNFIFGYGSLICPQSRAITAPTLSNATAEPVVVKHIERTWSASGEAHSGIKNTSPTSLVRGMTPVGVRFRRGAICNGVLICVDEEELFRFDKRELGYSRQRIDVADIHRHVDSELLINESMSLWPTESTDKEDNDESLSSREEINTRDVKCSECRLVFEKASEKRRKMNGKSGTDASCNEYEAIAVWVYVQNKDAPADRAFPISQSYVDIIMRGCLSISIDFARRFIETTHGWEHGEWLDQNEMGSTENDEENANNRDDRQTISTSNHYIWVNDRHAPLYLRADIEYSLVKGKEVDALIQEHRPRALKLRILAI